MQNTGTCYSGQGWFARNLGWGRQASAQVYLQIQPRPWLHILVFCTDLNLFYSIHFQFIRSLVGGVGSLQLWNGSVAFYHCFCDRNEAPAKDNGISQHHFFLGGEVPSFCWDDHIGWTFMVLAKLRDKIHNPVEIFNPGIKWREFLFVSVSTFTTSHSST